MTIEEILNAVQMLTFEERKKLIQSLFAEMPESGGLAGTIEQVGDWEAGKQSIRVLVNESLERTTEQLGTRAREES